MRSSRLLSMLMLCRTRERWTAAELADELEVSVRTVYRDVEALQASGVPLWTTTGPGGGIHLLPGWRTDLGALTGDEAAALSLAGAPDALAQLGLASVAASAQLKVSAALPPELRARSARIGERFHLDAPGWFQRPESTEHLQAIADAVWSERRLDLTYRRGERTVRRRLDPLGLVMKAGTWYLVAAHRGQVRSYRVSRVERCAPRNDPAQRPDGFVLSDWWVESSEAFDRTLLRYRCTLRCTAGGLRRLHDAVGATAAQDARATASPPDTDGWRTVELHGEGRDVLANQLLTLGPRVEVLEPPELRDEIVALIEATARKYRPEHAT
jgi:predicted DNA-binding transcriptional regulator YafY